MSSKSLLFNRIATELQDAQEIQKTVQTHKRVRPELETAFVPPRTPTERKLTTIWKELLSLDDIGVHDNFFDLGGHSLLATQLISRVRENFQIQVPLAVVFDTPPTVESMAALLEQYQIEQADTDLLAELLQELDGLSDEEIDALLAGGQP